MGKLKVMIVNQQKKVKIPPGLRLMIRRCCAATLQTERFGDDAEISVIFTDDPAIRSMNMKFRGIDRATDVLSFPQGENGVYDRNPDNGCRVLGDIVLSMEHAVRQAAEFGHTLQREVGYLTVHSMLHLLGYDHGEEDGLRRLMMREKEEEVLAKLGLTRDSTYAGPEADG